MKKILFFAGLLCVGSFANINAAETTLSDTYKTDVELSQGYRRDSLNLKVGGHKQHFKHVNEYTTRVGATVRNNNDYFLKGIIGYGDVYSGKVGHSNHHKVKGDYTADFQVTFGKDMRMSDGWSVSPTVGYGVYIQDFHTRHSHGKVKGTWYSPQAGLSVAKSFNDNLSAYATYMCLFPLNFQASVRHGKTYENKAYKSVGNIGTIGVNWMFASNWSLKPEIEVMKFYSKTANQHNSHKDTERSSVEYRLVLGYMF